ncbi:serine/threonine protein phosphatase [uncultured Campylobacter sp.]|uniref:serine/threonine protein phosphatase n=1 Tax=uncultured Campylobacter sp. TaxID=218934 RepID=UPI0026031202|nr:serine/threonine protein phosphatase [uncultured Campylobacter sp.]
MRILFILRGNYFNGQKEWLAKNGLLEYCLDLEEFRFLAGGLKSLINGYKSLEYGNASEILKTLMNFLELRMQKGNFCIVNAPNANNSLLKEYKDLAQKYRYAFYVLEFNELSLEQCKEKNLQEAQKSGVFIPEHILEAIDYGLNKEKISKKYKILKPDEYKKVLFERKNLNSYKKIHHIGDIQGCFTVLKKAINKIKDDEFYIFLGDYIDRGIENGKVIKWLLKIKDLKNVVLLEGNHERHLVKWANREISSSKEFNENTIKDFRKEKISQKDAKELYPSFKECFLYEFGEKLIFCSHGGLSYLPNEDYELSFIPTNELIMGVGGYDDSKIVADLFCKNTKNNTYQLFGHRNKHRFPIHISPRVFLCEGKVDDGGYLRVVSLNKNGFECKEFKNEVYKK